MLTGKTNTHPTHPKLLLLREALTAAERATPSRPRRADANEQRALQLIARMQARYKKTLPFLEECDIPVPQGVPVKLHEVAGAHAG